MRLELLWLDGLGRPGMAEEFLRQNPPEDPEAPSFLLDMVVISDDDRHDIIFNDFDRSFLRLPSELVMISFLWS